MGALISGVASARAECMRRRMRTRARRRRRRRAAAAAMEAPPLRKKAGKLRCSSWQGGACVSAAAESRFSRSVLK